MSCIIIMRPLNLVYLDITNNLFLGEAAYISVTASQSIFLAQKHQDWLINIDLLKFPWHAYADCVSVLYSSCMSTEYSPAFC